MLFLLSVQDQPANKNANILPKISHFHNNLEARKVTHILINALPNPRFVSFKKKKKVCFPLPFILYLAMKIPMYSK